MTKYLKILPEWLKKLRTQARVIAPFQEEDGFVSFKEAEEVDGVFLDFLNTRRPPKEFFFPPTETLLRFDAGDATLESADFTDEACILFGMRLCDALGLCLLDDVFSGEGHPPDPFYTARRKNTVLVGIFCHTPGEFCFCEPIWNILSAPSGVDILLYPLKEGYVLESMTFRGEEILSRTSESLEEIKAEQEEERRTLQEIAAKSFSISPPAQEASKILPGIVHHAYWEGVSKKCLECGICTLLCPTCSCFDVQDECPSKEGERFRCWDSCQFPGFSRMAGGLDPRPMKKERFIQRFYHKFSYAPERYGKIFCTGCGRCLRLCPVNVDITRILSDIMEL